MRQICLAMTAIIATSSAPAAAETAREMLIGAAFTALTKPVALARIEAALVQADAVLARNPADREARLQRAVAIGYRGKLNRSRGEVQTARKGFEALVASNPRDAEAQMALGGWHLGALIELGTFVARTGLGARRERGLTALDAAVASGGGRAIFPAFASLNRIQINPGDIVGARALAETALKSRVARPEDRIMQRHVAQLLPLLRQGNGKAAAALAERLMPFGRFSK